MSGENLIEVDPVVLCSGRSDYESTGYNTSTASLSSSINDYIFENGRRYHSYYGPEKNLMPTDDKEQDRLDLDHETYLQLLNGDLHTAPLKNPHRILDVGTGTGIWAIDMADKHPQAEVIGTDLSPIQPKWVPPNCKFEVDDAELDWTYKNNFFDFVHVRNLAQAISNWPRVMSEIYRCTTPGGYCELSEMCAELLSDDNSLPAKHPTRRVWDLFNEAMIKTGRPPATDTLLTERLKEAGFVEVHLRKYKRPIAPWPKDKRLKHIGAMTLLNMAYCLAAFTRVLNMEAEQALKICHDGLAGAKDSKVHMYLYYNVACGRKPA